MATNGGAHKFNKNDNDWLHKHFEPQQVDAVVSSISIPSLKSLSAFPRTHPLRIIESCNVEFVKIYRMKKQLVDKTFAWAKRIRMTCTMADRGISAKYYPVIHFTFASDVYIIFES